MGDVAGLLENLGGRIRDIRDGGLGLNHLRIPRDGGQGVFEFVGDAGREFAKSSEIVFELDLLLQSGELREVAEQADGAGYFLFAFSDRRNGDPEVAGFTKRRLMRDLFPPEDFSGSEAFTDEAREFRLLTQGFTVAAK